MAKKTNTGIPGLSFSWKRALGITQAKREFTNSTGIPTTTITTAPTTGTPTTKAGIERKIGSTILKALFGKK